MRKVAALDEGKIRELVEPSWLDKVERFLFSKSNRRPYDAEEVQRGIRREQAHLRKQLGVQPRLSGSMHNRTNLPGAVDVDFFVPLEDRAAYERAVAAIRKAPGFQDSPFNKPDAPFSVYTRTDPGTSGFPVDVAMAYGPDANQYVQAARRYKRGITGLSPEVKQQLLEMKAQLQDTPIFSKPRYRRFKRQLRELSGVPTLRRESIEKVSTILDMNTPSVRKAFRQFLHRKDVVGHRTTAGKDVVEAGSVLPSAELHRKGLLKNVEMGRVGRREDAATSNDDEKTKAHLKDEVFASRGGLLDEESYGDTGILAINRNATTSPYLNLLTNEVVIAPRSKNKVRSLNIGKGYIIAPRKRLRQFEKKRPEFKYIPKEDLDEELKQEIFLPTKSVKEVLERWVPALRRGNIKLPV